MSRARPQSASLIYGCERPADVRPLTRGDLSPAVRAEIRRLQRLEPVRNLRLLLLAPLGVLASAAGLARHPLLQAAGTVAMAAVLVSLSVIMHEGCHHLLLRSRFLNRALASCCGLPLLLSATAYRALHLRHHAFEHTPRDPDDIESLDRRGVPLVLVYYVMLALGTYFYFPHVAIEGTRAARGRRERVVIVLEYVAMAVCFGVAFRLAPHLMLRLWLLPMIVAAQLTNLRSLAEHGLTSGGSPFTATRSVRTTRLVAFLLCNLNLHLEHHLFPAVPWYNLPKVHELLLPSYRLAGASIYEGYCVFLRDFLRTTWSGVVPGVRLLPTHLREDLCA